MDREMVIGVSWSTAVSPSAVPRTEPRLGFISQLTTAQLLEGQYDAYARWLRDSGEDIADEAFQMALEAWETQD